MKSKTCRECKKDLPETEFYFSGHVTLKGKKIRDTLCKSCKVAYKKKRRRGFRKWLSEIKSNMACSKCGYSKETHPSFQPTGLTFHHPQDNKGFWIGDASSKGYSKESVLKEIDKCVCLCVRCHAEIHNHE